MRMADRFALTKTVIGAGLVDRLGVARDAIN